jgi:hypothetical protein
LSLLSGLPGTICRDWATPGEAPRWPVESSVPILILAGGYDAFQPDAAAIATPMGAYARVVEFAFAAHGVRGAGDCPRALVSAFLAAPQMPLDTACVERMQAPAFLDDMRALRGPAQLASSMISGQPPPIGLLVGALAALTAVVTVLAATVRRRRAKAALPAAGWLWAAAGSSFAALAAFAVAVLSIDPVATAALWYGLPAAWSWISWLLLPPAIFGGIALWRGRATWSVRIAGAAAIVFSFALGLAGWSPLA